MAGARTTVLIWPVDTQHDLFGVENAAPAELVNAILSTPWLDVPWTRQQGQELWPRRRIDNQALSWWTQWDEWISGEWNNIQQALGLKLQKYQGTAWWLDEPGFTCSLHTDGEMPGSMHLFWHGADLNLGTCFYTDKDSEYERHRFLMHSNCGYIMINQADNLGYRRLQWHGMLTPVPHNTFRLTSYTWMTPQ